MRVSLEWIGSEGDSSDWNVSEQVHPNRWDCWRQCDWHFSAAFHDCDEIFAL
jgi:hypothetical protein